MFLPSARKLASVRNTPAIYRKNVALTFAGLGIAELRRLRTLEEENKKLKQLVADLSLDKKMLQDVLSKKL